MFLWFLDKNFNNDVVDFHIKVQVFGNSPSPAVAIFGFRKAACDVENKFGSDVWQFMKKEFYMDGAFSCCRCTEKSWMLFLQKTGQKTSKIWTLLWIIFQYSVAWG